MESSSLNKGSYINKSVARLPKWESRDYTNRGYDHFKVNKRSTSLDGRTDAGNAEYLVTWGLSQEDEVPITYTLVTCTTVVGWVVATILGTEMTQTWSLDCRILIQQTTRFCWFTVHLSFNRINGQRLWQPFPLLLALPGQLRKTFSIQLPIFEPISLVQALLWVF